MSGQTQQIWEPDGLRIPGTWNGWGNTHNMGGDFDMNRVDRSGYVLWTTTFQAPGSGEQEFLFVSGNGDPYLNRWYQEDMVVDEVAINISYHGICYGCNNNSLTTTAGKYYTAHWRDNGYFPTDAVIMETTHPPREFQAIDPILPAAFPIAPGQALELTVALAGNKSPEERVFVRYSDDGFASSHLAEVVFSNPTDASGTATIPGEIHTSGAEITYYAYTTTVDASSSSPHDLIAIHMATNGGNNYSYSVEPEWKSVANGAWHDPGTWETNAIPAPHEPVSISDQTTVTVGTGLTAQSGNLRIQSGGNLIVDEDATLEMRGYIHNENDITGLVAHDGSEVHFNRGGYLEGPFEFYDLTVGNETLPHEINLYIVDSVALRNDLHIKATGELFTGTSSGNGALTFAGTSGSLYNEGRLHAGNGFAFLKVYFASGSNTILRPNSLLPERTKFHHFQVENGATVSADAFGALNIGFEGTHASLVNQGTLNFVSTSGGVRVFLLDDTDLVADFNGALETLFGEVYISENAVLRPGNGFTHNLNLTSDFSLYGAIANSLDGTGKFHLNFIGSAPQTILTDNETTPNLISIADITVDNPTSVRLKEANDQPPSTGFEVSGQFNLLRGVFKTLDTLEAGREDDLRYRFTILDKSLFDFPSGQSTTTPSETYIEGPFSIRTADNADIVFPLGGNGQYRPLEIQPSGVSPSEPAIFTAEHFNRSANFDGMEIPEDIVNISDLRFWNVKIDHPNRVDNVQFTLHYGDSFGDGVTSPMDLRVVWAEQDASTDADPSNDFWFNLGPTTGGGTNTIVSGPFAFQGNADLNKNLDQMDLTLGNVNTQQNPLPVEWMYFEGREWMGANLLEWATGSERNSDRFVVERSGDGLSFHPIGHVSARGFSTDKTEYRFTDNDPLPAVNYYRLRQVDLDGSHAHSRIIALQARQTSVSKIFPNPFDEFLTVDHPSGNASRLSLFDAAGRVILERETDSNPFRMDTSPLPPGFYTLRITDAYGSETTFKLVK